MDKEGDEYHIEDCQKNDINDQRSIFTIKLESFL